MSGLIRPSCPHRQELDSAAPGKSCRDRVRPSCLVAVIRPSCLVAADGLAAHAASRAASLGHAAAATAARPVRLSGSQDPEAALSWLGREPLRRRGLARPMGPCYSRASAGTMLLQSLASPGRWSIMVRCAVAPRASPGARRSVPAARLREASLAEQARFLRSGPAPLLAPVRLSEPRVAVPAGAGLSVSSQSTPARSRAGQHTNTRSHNSLNSIAGLVSWLLPALACGARPEKRRPAAAHKRTRAGLGGYPSPAVNALLQLRGPAH